MYQAKNPKLNIEIDQNTKILLKIFILVISFLATASAQWNTQSPVPTHLDVRGVGAPTTERVFIATEDNMFDEGGALFESTDGGATWTQLNVPASLGSDFNGLFFYDNQSGWAYGNENYRTTDGGTTWTPLPFLGSTYFMKFYTPTFGLATGNFEQYISYDGGNTWVESPNGIYSFDFINEQTGLGISAVGIYRTTDGGTSFNHVHSGNDVKAAIYLSNSNAVGISDNSFLTSADSGVTWTTGTSANNKYNLTKVSEEIILAWGQTGIWPNYNDDVFRSTDAGQSWTNLGEVIPAGIFATTVVNPSTITVADLEGNMFTSTDGGTNWTQTFNSTGSFPGYLSSAFPVFPDQQTGYFGYGNGFVIKTTDGGASWFQISSGSGESLNDIDRFENGNMIAVGDNGTLLTSNGTSSWLSQEISTPLNLTAVQVLNSADAVIVDEEGQIYISTDGGASWNSSGIKPANNFEAKDIHFTTLLDGWVAGDGSTGNSLHHTTDGGATWIGVPDFGGYYTAVDFEGVNGWVMNVGNRYYRTSDSGLTWTQEEFPFFPVLLYDIDFYNGTTGYAVGGYGFAVRSNDGGLTWNLLPTPNTDDSFTDIHLSGSNELWLSTNNDKVYYSATGGQSWTVFEVGSSGFGYFSAITASPDGEAWIVGESGLIEYFEGPPPPPANILPDAMFSFSTSGLTVEFTDMSSDPDGIIVSWKWNFGDGTMSTEQNPTHTYDTADTYIVNLTVTDDDGDSSIAGKIIVVQPGPGGVFGDFTEVTPLDSLFVTPQDEDFWVTTTAPADYDNDGDLDVAILGYYVVYNQSAEDKLVLVRNDGPASATEWEFSYIDVPLGDLYSGASDLSWGDFDNDGDQDLIVGSYAKTILYRNDAGTLNITNIQLPGYWEDNDQADFDLRSITWADFDNDGDQDLLIPSAVNNDTSGYKTALMRNDGPDGSGGWIFSEIESVFTPTSHAQSMWADFDNDQDLDLLLINIAPLTDEGFIRRYRNDGNGVFVGEDLLSTLSIEHGEAQWGDYDGDGDLDILVAGNVRELDSTYTHMALRIYRNDNETYVPLDVVSSLPGEGWFDITAASWADYDSDGDIDILVAGTHNPNSQIVGRARIYENDGLGNFTYSGSELPAPRASGDRGGTFSWLDLDNDGDLDYFIAGEYWVPGGNNLIEAQMHVYRNDAEGQNLSPTVPTGLNSTFQKGVIVRNGTHTPTTIAVLTWIPSTDDHTPAPAITYELELFKDNFPVTLPKYTPQPGNVSAINEWRINDLKIGNYQWTLRAVDGAFISSEVAVGVFSIGILSAEDEDNPPEVYSLEQNYPNPFNPVTTIKYSLPEDGMVSLKIFNLLGEEVATLVNNEVKQAGSYNLVFDAANFASGVYFYRIQAGKFTQVRKMIISK